MQTRSSFRARLGAVLFFTGLILAAAISFIVFWPDLEASLFDTNTVALADEPLRTLRCPHVITASETGQVQASLTNPGERDITMLVRARVSQGIATLMREESETVQLAPGETLEMAWPVNANDAAYGRVVLARVFVTKSAVTPARQSACGVLLVKIAGPTGQQLLGAGLIVSLLALGAGGGTWLAQQRPLTGGRYDLARAFSILTAIILASLVAGLWGWWLAGLILLASAILFIGVMLERFARH